MRKTILFFLSALTTQFSFGQNAEYSAFIKTADSLYKAKDYKNSALTYSKAFETLGWEGYLYDRYNAACSWALANIPDSAFFQLNKIATESNFKDYRHISIDPDLNSLHSDNRWTEVLNLIKQNKEKAEANLDKPLMAQLDSIFTEDQKYRLQIDEIEKEFGWDSKEMKAHWKIINEKDSINLIKIKNILDTKGWLGEDIVGEQGNTTLFLVIQHSDIETQEIYLPMMREAVKNSKAQASDLALLEDRVALTSGKKQIYGSQIGINPQTQLYYVSPLEDPDNVDKRRAEVGLQPMAEYVSNWQIKWDVEQYKKDLPTYEKLENQK